MYTAGFGVSGGRSSVSRDDESYAISLNVREVDGFGRPCSAPREYAWTAAIITDIVKAIVPSLYDAEPVGNGMALLFAGPRHERSRGYSWQEVQCACGKLEDIVQWVGRGVTIEAIPIVHALA